MEHRQAIWERWRFTVVAEHGARLVVKHGARRSDEIRPFDPIHNLAAIGNLYG